MTDISREDCTALVKKLNAGDIMNGKTVCCRKDQCNCSAMCEAADTITALRAALDAAEGRVTDAMHHALTTPANAPMATNADMQDAMDAALTDPSDKIAEAARVPDLDPVQVGEISNHYGGLWIKATDGVAYWSIMDYSGDTWDVCPMPVFIALRALAGQGETL